MKVYINTDIEGVAGWVFYANLKDDSAWNYHHTQRMNRLLTAEVNAAAQACKEEGAEEVYVCDSHGPAYNILVEELDPVCRVIHGRPGHGPNWLPLLDASFDAAIAIGVHARAGTEAAVCPHSYWHVVDGDGHRFGLGECGMFAALAGTKQVPFVALSGDDKVVAEVKELIPACEGAVVKTGLAAQNCCTLTPVAARQRIAEAVRRGLAKRTDILPFTLKGPFKINLSDRDPRRKELEHDMEGDDLWALMHEACRCFGNRWGAQGIDDRSWRYPKSLFA